MEKQGIMTAPDTIRFERRLKCKGIRRESVHMRLLVYVVYILGHIVNMPQI